MGLRSIDCWDVPEGQHLALGAAHQLGKPADARPKLVCYGPILLLGAASPSSRANSVQIQADTIRNLFFLACIRYSS